MTKTEKKDKLKAMIELDIPSYKRSAFMRFANDYGRFNLYNDWKWYEYSPLEAKHRCTLTMEQMWKMYNDKINLKTK